MNKEQLRNPILRFKEFNDTNYKNIKIFEISNFMRSGGTPKSDNVDYYNGLIPFVAIPDMSEKYLLKTCKHISEEGLNNSSAFVFNKYNLLLSMYATIGEISINKIDIALPQSILGIIFKENIILEYMYYVFQKNKNKFIKMQQIGSQPNISLEIVKNIKLFISKNSQEQNKIANFFCLLDKRIELIKRKLSLWQQKKNYYLNKLFCGNDEATPLLRFKEFNDTNYKNIKIFEISNFMRSGGTPKSDNVDYYNGLIPFVAIPDMSEKYLLKTCKHISEEGLNNSSAFVFNKYNLLLSMYATIGEISINKIDIALPQSILGIIFKENIILEYMYYVFQKNKNKFIKMQQIGSQPNISLEIVKNIKLFISKNSQEQNKIANFFCLLDKRIELIKTKLSLWQQKKRYYLNNMFL